MKVTKSLGVGIAALLALGSVIGVASVAVANPEPKVVVCKYVGTPGVDETLQNTITVNANALGHDWDGVTFPFAFNDAHDHSVAIGLEGTTATCPAPVGPPPPPVVVDETPDPLYAVALWNMEPSGETPDFDPDQTLAQSVVGLTTPNLNYFDSYLTGECKAYQIDVYKYNVADGSKAQVDTLFAGQILYSPNNPAEPLIAGGFGTAWKFYVNTNCEQPKYAAPLVPAVKDLCAGSNDHYGIPAATEGITYSRDGLAIVATLQDGYSWGSVPAGYAVSGNVATYAFNPALFTHVPCDEQPQPKLTYSEVTEGEFGCGDTTVQEFGTLTTTPWVYSPEIEGYVEDTEHAVTIDLDLAPRVLDADEIEACPQPPEEEPKDKLAYTGGGDGLDGGLIAALVLLATGAGVIVIRKFSTN